VAGKGRPVIGPEVKTTLRPDTIAALEREAAEQGLKRSELIRTIIERHVATCRRTVGVSRSTHSSG